MAVIGLSLLIFVLSDILGNKGGSFSSNVDVGTIGDHDISYEEYQHTVDYYTSVYNVMYGQNAISEEVSEEVRSQAWQALVRKYVYDVEYEGLDLVVTSDELFDLIQGRNPSPLVVRNFTNPQTGIFDRGVLLRYLQNLDQNPDGKTYWLFLEKEIVSQRLQAKLTALVSKAMYVTAADAKNTLNNSAKTVSIQYVSKPLNTYPDSLVKVSASDIAKYYSKHKEQYKQTASRDVELVTFAIAPSEEDDWLAKTWIEELAPKFKVATDLPAFVAQHSDKSFNGTYYKQGELPETLNSFAFSAKPDDMLGPLLTDGAYKLARIISTRTLPDSVKAQHILLDGGKGLDVTRKLADSIKAALYKGASFAELSAKYSIDNVANENGGDVGWFQQSAMVKPFGDSCFFAPRGRIMVVETQFGVHVVVVTDKSAEAKKVQLAVVERAVEPSRVTREGIFSKANELAVQSVDHASFVTNSDAKGYMRKSAPRMTINDKNVAGLQQARELVRWAYEDKNKKDAISSVFEIDNNFVVASLVAVRKDGYAPVEQVTPEISATLLSEKKAEKIAEDMKGAADLNSLAERLNVSVQTMDNVNFSSYYWVGVGIEPKLAAVASASQENQLSEPVQGLSGVYVFSVTSRSASELTDEQVAQEKERLQSSIPMRMNYELFQSLYTEAGVKDLRGRVY